MLIDLYLPRFDVREVHEVDADAPPEVTFAAIRQTDLRDPITDALFALRELPNRITRKLRHQPPPPASKSFTFEDIAKLDMGWVPLDELPGVEFVVGSVGRFWARDYGWKPVAADAFVAFEEPGYAKVAVSFRVVPRGVDGSCLR